MKLTRSLCALLGAILVVASSSLAVQPAAAHHSSIRGYVTDAVTGQPIPGICVTRGVPPPTCEHSRTTDANGFYLYDVPAWDGVMDGGLWDLFFVDMRPAETKVYEYAYSGTFTLNGPVSYSTTMFRLGATDPCATEIPGAATSMVYLPNITKTLGGPDGWQTPFIVQNRGANPTTLEISFYRFFNGACVTRRTVTLAPGTSFADVPNNDPDLPHDTQFSVVVKSFGAPIVAVVNEHQGSGARAEALSYTGTNTGAFSVFLPNIVREFFGYVTPFIIQNLGTGPASVTATFRPFDGSHDPVVVGRSIESGRSKFVNPNSDDTVLGAPGLIDGKQYAVTVAGDQPLTVVVNTHNDAPSVQHPVAYATNGLTTGATSVRGAYAAKGHPEHGVTTIVVQNLGPTAVTPRLTFRPLGAALPAQVFDAPAPVAPGAAWAFDPRFANGIAAASSPLCGSAATSACLGDGEYSFVATAAGQIAAVVNVIGSETAMGYAATPAPAPTYYLPNVTRTLGGPDGWTTPILLQSATAAGATLEWYRFTDGVLAHTQTVTIPIGSAVRIDPRSVGVLSDNTQYAVVVRGIGGTVSAIVMELAVGGDNAMIYEGFPAP